MKTLTFYLEVYGCQMNVYDGQLIQSILQKQVQDKVNYRRVKTPIEAEVLLFNTCAIREKAFQTISRRIAALEYLKHQGSERIFVLLGCLAQSLGKKIWSLGLSVDLILGPDNYRSLPQLLQELRGQKRKREKDQQILTKLSRNENYDNIHPYITEKNLSAYVTIMRGCDNFCTFCVVPYTRGRERSRSIQSILTEINYLIEEYNIKEITLLGQNVNSYRSDNDDFTGLIEQIIKKTTIRWIRFTSPHPKDFPRKLLDLMAQEERFCSQIHLPLQSGSDCILEKMNRNYLRDEFLRLVKTMRDAVPDLGLTTDVIVGFCGETEKDFLETLEVMREVEFDMAYMFRYSVRNNTLASRKFKDDVPETTKLQRLEYLIKLQQEISANKNKKFVGNTFKIMIVGDSKRSTQEWHGKSACGKKIIFAKKNNDLVRNHSLKIEKDAGAPDNGRREYTKPLPLTKGDFSVVKIIDSTSATFRGTLLEKVHV